MVFPINYPLYLIFLFAWPASRHSLSKLIYMISFVVFLFLQANCNLICSEEYGPETKHSMAQLNEKETSFELIEALLIYIKTLNVPGAVLVFLPGWNLIYTMQKHLEMNPRFGTSNCVLLCVIFSKGNYWHCKDESWMSGLGSWICHENEWVEMIMLCKEEMRFT